MCRNGRGSPPGISQPCIGTLPGLRHNLVVQAGQEGQCQIVRNFASSSDRTCTRCGTNRQCPMADTVVIDILGVSRRFFVVMAVCSRPRRIDAATVLMLMEWRTHLVNDE